MSIYKSVMLVDLIEKSKKGNSRAQRELYDRLAPKMFSVCCRYIKYRDEAENVLLESMNKMFEKLRQFRQDGNFEGWVRRIVINQCLINLRKNSPIHLELDLHIASEQIDIKALEGSMEADDLIKLINSLPVLYRVVFNLYAIEGYQHAEIANLLGITLNTSKSRLNRARKWLQNRLLANETQKISLCEMNEL